MKSIKTMMMVLSLSVMYQFASAQQYNCNGNKQYVCRLDSCGLQECKCVSTSQVASWLATTPPCQTFHWHPHCCDGFRVIKNESGSGINTSLEIYPNPSSGTAIIFFSLSETQKVSLKLLDLTGRLVTTLEEDIFEEGGNEFTWNASEINAGIYFLQLNTGSYSAIKKISIVK